MITVLVAMEEDEAEPSVVQDEAERGKAEPSAG